MSSIGQTPGKWLLSDKVKIDTEHWDFSWRPDPYDPPYIHQFGTQWQIDGGPRFVVKGATEVKYHGMPKARALAEMSNWKILNSDIDTTSFDFSWHSSEEDESSWIFGGDDYSAEEMPCLEYMGSSNIVQYNADIKVKMNSVRSLDVVFMSNGESVAEENYNNLCEIAQKYVKRVQNIPNRELAIKECAKISDTDWVLVVPAKLKLYNTFNLAWQPKRTKPQRHFVFYADNPLNGLCYGHMAPVAYNCELVNKTDAYDLDFTMSKAHEIVPLSAGVANFNHDSWTTWRTAFREVIKLKYSTDHGDLEANDRMQVWLNVAHGDFAKFCLAGARDAIQYYCKVNGDLSKLKLTFHWQWLAEYAKQLKHNFNT